MKIIRFHNLDKETQKIVMSAYENGFYAGYSTKASKSEYQVMQMRRAKWMRENFKEETTKQETT